MVNQSEPRKKKTSFAAKAFRAGSYSLFACVAIVAIAVVINLLVHQLPPSVTKVDITANQLYTLSDQTKEVVRGLEQDVDVYLIVQKGGEDQYIQELLDRYDVLSDRLHIHTVDPLIDPQFAEKYIGNSLYNSDNLYNNSIVVTSGDVSYFISYYDIYVYDYSAFYYSQDTNDISVEVQGESQLTAAIRYVINNELPQVYALTGHGEATLSDAYGMAVTQQNVQLDDLSLLTASAIPADCDCLLINNPTSDLSRTELELVLDYLAAGGSLLLLTGEHDYADCPNLLALLDNYSVTLVSGLVLESDHNYFAYNYPNFLLPQLQTHDITAPLIQNKYAVIMPSSQGIVLTSQLRAGVAVGSLLKTSSSSYAKTSGGDTETIAKTDADIDGPFNLGVAITDSANAATHIVWFSSAYLADDQANEMVSGHNLDLFLNALSWCCGAPEADMSIHSKNMDSQFLTVPHSTATLWTVIMVLVLPAICLAIGLIILIKRRRR